MYDLLWHRHLSPEEKAKLQQQEEEERRLEREAQERIRQQELERRRRQEALQMRYEDNSMLFLDTPGLYLYDPDGSISSQELYQIYRRWCISERIPLATPREFWLRMRQYAPEHALTYCIFTDSSGKRHRGFRGICPLPANTDHSDITDNTDF